MYHDRFSLSIKFFILGLQIIVEKAQWGLSLLLYGEFAYVPLYLEWTECVLACFDQHFRDCSIYQAVYASLYSYSRDAHVLRAFCESWCPTTNILHTLSGELSITLWELHHFGGLLIYDQIYDKTIPSSQIFSCRDKQGQRVIPSSCGFLFTVFRCLEKAHSHDKGVTAKTLVNLWCKQKLVHHPPTRFRHKT